MTPEKLVPCLCKFVVTRDPKTMASRTRVFVDNACPHHGAPRPAAPKEKK